MPPLPGTHESENLKNEEELQSYFIHRMGDLLKSKGKKLVGWDEILEGGLAPDANVMSWRGMDGGIKSAKARASCDYDADRTLLPGFVSGRTFRRTGHLFHVPPDGFV